MLLLPSFLLTLLVIFFLCVGILIIKRKDHTRSNGQKIREAFLLINDKSRTGIGRISYLLRIFVYVWAIFFLLLFINRRYSDRTIYLDIRGFPSGLQSSGISLNDFSLSVAGQFNSIVENSGKVQIKSVPVISVGKTEELNINLKGSSLTALADWLLPPKTVHLNVVIDTSARNLKVNMDYLNNNLVITENGSSLDEGYQIIVFKTVCQLLRETTPKILCNYYYNIGNWTGCVDEINAYLRSGKKIPDIDDLKIMKASCFTNIHDNESLVDMLDSISFDTDRKLYLGVASLAMIEFSETSDLYRSRMNDILQTISHHHPRNSDEFFYFGNIYYSNGNYKKSLELYRRADAFPGLYQNMASNYIHLKEYDSASYLFTRLDKYLPNDVYSRAPLYYFGTWASPAEYRRNLELCEKESPHYKYLPLGKAIHRLFDEDRDSVQMNSLVKDLNQFLAKNPGDATATFCYAVALENEGHYAEAIGKINLLLKKYPFNPDLHNALFDIYLKMGAFQTLIHRYNSLNINFRRYNTGILCRYAEAKERKDPNYDGAEFKLAYAINPDNQSVCSVYAEFLMQRRLYNDAISVLSNALVVNKRNEQFYRDLLNCYENLQRVNEVTYYGKKLLELDSLQKSTVFDDIGTCYQLSGNLDSAELYLTKSVVAGINSEALLRLFYFKVNKHDYRSALLIAEKINKAKVPDLNVDALLGDLYYQRGDFYRAKSHYFKYLLKNSHDCQRLLNYRDCETLTGNFTQNDKKYYQIFLHNSGCNFDGYPAIMGRSLGNAISNIPTRKITDKIVAIIDTLISNPQIKNLINNNSPKNIVYSPGFIKNVFPNPVLDSTTIDCYLNPGFHDCYLNIYSPSFQLVLTYLVPLPGDNLIMIDLSKLPFGKYTCVLNIDGRKLEKVILIHANPGNLLQW